MERVEVGCNKQETEFKTFRQEETDLKTQLRDIQEKLEDIENNKRNNLILYGLPNDPYESHGSLHQKVSHGGKERG